MTSDDVRSFARGAYGVIAPHGAETDVRGGRRGEAWFGFVLCALMVGFSVWMVAQPLSWALGVSDPWLAVLAWVVVVVALLIGLFFVGLLVIVALGGDLFGRDERDRPEPDRL